MRKSLEFSNLHASQRLKLVRPGELDGLSRKRRPVCVNSQTESRGSTAVALNRWPKRARVTDQRRAALSVRSRCVRGPTATHGVTLGTLRGAAQTLALSGKPSGYLTGRLRSEVRTQPDSLTLTGTENGKGTQRRTEHRRQATEPSATTFQTFVREFSSLEVCAGQTKRSGAKRGIWRWRGGSAACRADDESCFVDDVRHGVAAERFVPASVVRNPGRTACDSAAQVAGARGHC